MRSGEIEAREVALPLPAAYVYPEQCITEQEAWTFNGYDLDGVSRLAREAGVAAPDAARMRAASRCDARGCVVWPDAALIGALTPAARDRIYQTLYRFPENRLHADAAIRPAALGRWSDDPRLSPFVRELMGRATWTIEGRYAFSDLAWLCSQLRSVTERSEFMAVLYTRYSLDAKVRVPPTGDLEPMIRYWSVGNDPDETRRALEGARSNDGRVAVAALLPLMARVRLNRFPSTADLEYDCFWSTTHFFDGPTPRDDFPDNAGIAPLLHRAYREIPMVDARLGDVIALLGSTGAVVHTANYVAGDIVFTKNGRPRMQPWILMRLGELLRYYRFTSPRVYRLR